MEKFFLASMQNIILIDGSGPVNEKVSMDAKNYQTLYDWYNVSYANHEVNEIYSLLFDPLLQIMHTPTLLSE